MRITIIGAGWNGCHLAIELTKAGHTITVLEKHPTIFSGCSGKFGIRLHRGPHYPRSKTTRKSCHASFERFCETYPEIIKHHENSIYAHGERDAEGYPSKVSADTFEDVCFETKECQKVDVEAKAIQGVTAAYDLDEPSVAVGTELRSFFERKLAAEGVEILLDAEVERMRKRPYGPVMVFYRIKSTDDGCTRQTRFLDADFVVNATGYQSLTPNLDTTLDAAVHPLGFDVVYQACLAFRYEDTAPGEKPISFIVMDGWFPCLMPSIDYGPAADQQRRRDSGYSTEDESGSAGPGPPSPPPPPQRQYILTHGSYTILGSFPRPEQAQDLVDRVCASSSSSSSSTSNAAHLTSQLRIAAETEMGRFWPLFRTRFRYRGCQGSVLAKLRTGCEFRSSVVFARERVVYVFPGKISNVFRACDDVLSLIVAGATTTGAGVKAKGVRNEDEKQGGEDAGEDGEEKEEEEVVIVDGCSFVKRALAEADEARSSRGGVVSGGDVNVEVNDNVQGADASGRSTCDLQTFQMFQMGGDRAIWGMNHYFTMRESLGSEPVVPEYRLEEEGIGNGIQNRDGRSP